MLDGEPWWVGKDVCDCLGINNNRQAVSRLDADEKRDCVSFSDAIGRNRSHTVISEPGLYQITMRAKGEIAKDFRRWLAHDVIPALRRDGTYSLPGLGSAQPGDWDVDDMPDFLPPREIMAWVNAVNSAGKWFGASAARKLWSKCPLPTIYREGQRPSRSPMSTAGESAMRFLLSARMTRWPELAIADCLGIGPSQPDIAEELQRLGLLQAPEGYREFLAVAIDHPSLRVLFRTHPSGEAYASDMRAILGAQTTPDLLVFGAQRFRAVLVPLDAVTRLAPNEEEPERQRRSPLAYDR